MNFLAVLLLCLFVTLPGNVRAEATARAPAAKHAGKARKSPKKAPSQRSPKRTSSNAVGTRVVRPGTLQAMAVGVLERNSPSEQHALGLFAQSHHADVNGVLAHLVLGYHAYQEKRFTEATKHLEASQAVPSPIRDYGEYYLALSEIAGGDQAAAVALLDGFAARYPSSPLAAPATLNRSESLLALGRPAEVIALLLSPPVTLSQVATDLLLGEAYEKDQQPSKAVQVFQSIHYLYPTSWQAAQAEKHLRGLKSELGEAYPAPSEEMRLTRAERLFGAAQWKDAESEYRSLATLGSSAARDRSRVRVGVCQFRAGDTAAALITLKDMEVSDPEADAERLYTMAAIYRRIERPETMEELIQLLGRMYPESPWYEKALFAAGTYYWPSTDPVRAAQFHRMVFQQFPNSDDAVESHWRVAWQSYRERRLPEAKRLFEEHIRTYPKSTHLPAAIYWLGRTLEPDSPASAAFHYRKLVETFPNYYYGLTARQRLAKLPKLSAAGEKSEMLPADLLDPIRRPVPGSALDGTLSASEEEHRRRARLLESAWLIDLAIGELKAGIGKDTSASSLGWELAHLEEERGRYNVALEYAKHLLNGYLTFEVAELPREDWELLFPLPWWAQIKEKAEAEHLDPYLVAGLIRQESEFNAEARSRSNALGLMQLLPATARRMARQIPSGRARVFRLSALNSPEFNVTYGTRYLRLVLDQFNGSLEEALAAYNAGENRVVQWLQDSNYDEPAEFVESIPFTETREYVQAVLRNAALYHKLYQDSR